MLLKRIYQFFCFFALSSTILSCSHLNEFGQRRVNFNLERIKPSKDNLAYEIIDTSVLYKKVDVKNTFDSSKNIEFNRLNNLNPSYLKFYDKGKVGKFNNVSLDKRETLNPEKAESYLYNFKNNKFTIQVYFKNAQCGECFIKGKVEKISKDTIQIVSGDYIEKYKAIEIPKAFLIYTPDW